MIKEYLALAVVFVLLVLTGIFYLGNKVQHSVLEHMPEQQLSVPQLVPDVTTNSKVILDTVDKKQVLSLNLSESNTVVIVGEINGSALNIAQEITRKAQDGSPLYLLINSPGGSVLDGVQIVSAMQAAKVPIYTVCVQICASMASIIFENGKKRYMVDRSIIMFHEAAGGLSGPFNQMKTRFNFLNRFVNKLDYEIAQRIGVDPDVFRAQLANELWLDAEDAVKQHYADRLVNVNISFLNTGSGPAQEKMRSQTEELWGTVDVNLYN